MNKKSIILVITSLIFIVGCKNDSPQNSKTSVKENEITNVISYFEILNAVDGNLDSGENEDFKEILELKIVKNDTLNWCYDTQNLLKIEILGYISDATILYKDSNNAEKIILDHISIDGSYSIVPTSYNSINGGKIIIKSNDKVLKEIIINYEGCL
jgi:hypothetical protein